MIYTSFGFKQTEDIGKRLALSLTKSGVTRAFIALFGEVGVGKTVFTRGFAEALGTVGIKSPTYTIVNEHQGGSVPIYHFDFYRIEDSDDLASIGFDDYLAREGYAIAEWCEKIPEDIPDDAIVVKISRAPDNEDARIIEINKEISDADPGV